MVRIDETTQRGIAVATDGNGRYCALDPYAGAQLALAEAYRNVAVTGATPLAVTNCLNFGAPTDPGVMWQFQQAVRGLADGCAALSIPVTGGNVSFYNQTGDTAILPTPIIGVLGVIDDVRRRIRTGFGGPGDEVWLLGDTRDEFGGSEWAHEVHGHLGGRPPAVDLAREQALAEVLAAASRDGLVSGAHDLSDGGLAQALVEAALVSGHGARVTLPVRLDPFVALFAESAGRVVLGVPGVHAPRVAQLCTDHGVPVTRLGKVHATPTLEITTLAPLPLTELHTAWHTTLPTLFSAVDYCSLSPERGEGGEEHVDEVGDWLDGRAAEPGRAEVGRAVRLSLRDLARVAPGATVEVRVPPFAAVQCVAGPRHTRGTPPNLVETDPRTWLELATGRLTWAMALAEGRVAASGTRADLSAWLPLGNQPPG
jgi:selenophosphate synthetase-related protein